MDDQTLTTNVPHENVMVQIRNAFIFQNLEEDLSDPDLFEMTMERLAAEFNVSLVGVKRAAFQQNWLEQRERNRAHYNEQMEVNNFRVVEKIVADKLSVEELMISRMTTFVDRAYPRLMEVLDSRIHMMSDKDLIATTKLMLDTMKQFIDYNRAKTSQSSGHGSIDADLLMIKEVLSLNVKSQIIEALVSKQREVPVGVRELLSTYESERATAFAELEQKPRQSFTTMEAEFTDLNG